jgi:epoxide hydrolase 4
VDAELKPRHREIETNSVRLHTVEAGPEGGPPLVLLHGFPEFWYGWRKQIGPLAAAGFHVLVPDQRGYNTSDKPRRVRDYDLDLLARDVVGLIDQIGGKALVAGHDWGGAVAWWLGCNYPEHLERLAILNCPHPLVMRDTLLKSSRQRKMSFYMFLFQVPWLPERTFSKNNYAAAIKAFQATSRPGTFTEADFERYREAWSHPGEVRSMIHWYRAALRSQRKWPREPRVRNVPTMLIWGARDRNLLREMARPSIDLCDDGRLEFIEEASHWVQHEEPERVNRLLLDFLAATRAAAAP